MRFAADLKQRVSAELLASQQMTLQPMREALKMQLSSAHRRRRYEVFEGDHLVRQHSKVVGQIHITRYSCFAWLLFQIMQLCCITALGLARASSRAVASSA